MKVPENISVYFRDPRLEMTVMGRLLVRVSVYLAYGILLASTASFLISDIRFFRWIAIFFLFFLADRLYHRGNAERSLKNLKSGSRSVNVKDYLRPATWAILESSFDRSLIGGGDLCLRIFKNLLSRNEVQVALMKLEINPDEVSQKLDDYLRESLARRPNRKEMAQTVEGLVLAAFQQAAKSDSRFVNPYHLIGAFGTVKNDYLTRLFSVFSIQPSDLEYAIIFSRFHRRFWQRLPRSLGGFASRPREVRHRIMNRAWTSRPTPTLDSFSADFTDLARSESVGFLIGHQTEYDRLVDVLSRPAKPNALMIGEPGSGKETVIAHLAFNITKDEVPPPLFDKRLVALQISALVANAPSGELQGRVQQIVNEITAAGNIILYIPDIHNLVKTSAGGYVSAADQLLQIINNDMFPVIGSTYPREFKQLIEPRSDFANSFEIIRVEEVSEEDAIRILSYDSLILERQYGVVVTFGAVKESAQIARKYFHDKLLPSSAEDLLKEALADALERREKIVNADSVVRIAEKRINVPLHRATATEAAQLLNLEDFIHQRLIDQEEAVKAVAQALREYRSGLSRKGGPIAAFLFVGPTGVGKTELSKILARIQFGSEKAMIRFDMSEYQDKPSISRLIGSSDGGISGTLTEAVRQKPYSLVLLDEFEKANADILNLFLQVFDDGRLTDNLGRTIDFQNTVIIATSNAHSAFIKEQIEAGKAISDIAVELQKKLTDYFRPELINRFSKTIVFQNLSLPHIEAIARMQLQDVAATLRESHGIDAEFDDAAVKKIAELGFSPVFGARPLRGVISDKIKSVFADKILRGEIAKGVKVRIVCFDGEFTFENVK